MKVLVLQVKIGESNYWTAYDENQSYKQAFNIFEKQTCIPSVEAWAKRCGYDYHLQTTSTFTHPEIFSTKYQSYCAERLMHLYKDEYDYIIHVDADVYVSQEAEPFPIKPGLSISSWSIHEPFFKYRGLDLNRLYFNAGVYCVDRETGKRMSESIFNTMIPSYTPEKYNHGDQCFINEWILSNGCNVLDRNWNCSVEYTHDMTEHQMCQVRFLHFAWTEGKERHIEYFNKFTKAEINNIEVANFFWHGPMTNLEESCIKSFVKAGFLVKLWSYTNILVDGVESLNAEEILPITDLHKYSYVDSHTNNHISTMAAFADVFRLNLLSKHPGWWFDTDCYCLSSSKEFKRLRINKPIVIGRENEADIVNSIMYLSPQLAKPLLDQCMDLCKTYDNRFEKWGMIGPALTTSFIKNNNLMHYVVDINLFFPIHYDDINILIDPNLMLAGKEKIKNSMLIHLWDSLLVGKYGIDKNNLPRNTLLKELLC